MVTGLAGTSIEETQAEFEKLDDGSTNLAGKTADLTEVTIVNAPERPGDRNTLRASRPVNNKHVKGNVELHFHDIVTDDAFPWCHTVNVAIAYQAAGASKNDCVDVAHIELDIIDTSVPAREGEETWMEYLLDFSADYDDPLRPVGVMLRSLLDTSGEVREDARKFGDVLGSRTFVFVCELELATESRQKGVGSVAMEILHRMLPFHLGHGDAAMLLQPAGLDRAVSKEMEGEYQKMLFRFYGSLGYEKWFATKNGAKAPYTLMGRRL